MWEKTQTEFFFNSKIKAGDSDQSSNTHIPQTCLLLKILTTALVKFDYSFIYHQEHWAP